MKLLNLNGVWKQDKENKNSEMYTLHSPVLKLVKRWEG